MQPLVKQHFAKVLKIGIRITNEGKNIRSDFIQMIVVRFGDHNTYLFKLSKF